jgi:hypothetical protein
MINTLSVLARKDIHINEYFPDDNAARVIDCDFHKLGPPKLKGVGQIKKENIISDQVLVEGSILHLRSIAIDDNCDKDEGNISGKQFLESSLSLDVPSIVVNLP